LTEIYCDILWYIAYYDIIAIPKIMQYNNCINTLLRYGNNIELLPSPIRDYLLNRDRLKLQGSRSIDGLYKTSWNHGNQVSMVSDQQVRPCPTRPMPSYATA